MVHILTFTVKKIKQTFSKNTFQKQSKFGYYFRFTLFCFLKGRTLEFICAS